MLASSTNKVANDQQRNGNNSINNSMMHVGIVLRHENTITMASRRHTRAAIAMRRKSGADDASHSHNEYFEQLEIAMRRRTECSPSRLPASIDLCNSRPNARVRN